MAKVSKSQMKAKDNYEKRNPVQAFYWQKKSSAKSYIAPSPTTKLYKLVKTDNNIKDTYLEDLKDFKQMIEKTIEDISKM